MELRAEKRAVIYCRVSTKEQVEEGSSLSTQEKICREYAEKHGFEIIQVFIEQGESAKTADRTELQKLLSFCSVKKNGTAAVIAYKLDRISRNTDDYSQIRILLKRYGVEIKSTSEFFENTPAGRFMENIIANVAQFDNDVRAERCATGMREAVREGRYVWLAPIGYSNVKIYGKSTIEQSELAPLIREAFEKVVKGRNGVNKIRLEMATKGLTGKNGLPLSIQYFHKMLKNELYAGWINKFKERHKGTFEPIITDTLFKLVQYILKGKKDLPRHYQYDNPDFPLRKFIRDLDGNKITGGWCKGCTKTYAYYRFIKSKKDYRKEFLESSYVEYLQKFSLDTKYYLQFKKLLNSNLVIKTENAKKRRLKLQEELIKYKKRLKFLLEKSEAGIISDSVLKEESLEMEKEIYQIELQLSEDSADQPMFTKLLESVAEFIKNPGKVWEKASFSQKLRLQKFEFPEGLTFDGKNFATQKICNILKLKKEVFAKLESLVDYRFNYFELSTSDTSESNIDSVLYWDQVGKELILLNDILNGPTLLEIEGKNPFLANKKQ